MRRPRRCDQCNKLYLSSSRDSRFCTVECYQAHRSSQKTVLEDRRCPGCNKLFSPRSFTTRFCSAECSRRYQGETSPERNTRLCLEYMGLEFVQGKKFGRYFVDFWLPKLSVAIEIDGKYWHQNKEERESARDAFIESKGYKVLKFAAEPLQGEFQEAHIELVRSIVRKATLYDRRNGAVA